jgi:hypothetical protein
VRGCTGRIWLYSYDGLPADRNLTTFDPEKVEYPVNTSFACKDLTAYKKRVYFPREWSLHWEVNSTWSFWIETGAVKDMADNPVTIAVTRTYHEFTLTDVSNQTMVEIGEEEYPVTLMYSEPCHECEVQAAADLSVKLTFNTPMFLNEDGDDIARDENANKVSGQVGEGILRHCGSDSFCEGAAPDLSDIRQDELDSKADVLLRYVNVSAKDGVVSVDLEGILAPGRYQVYIPKGTVLVGWNTSKLHLDAQTVEFIVVPTRPMAPWQPGYDWTPRQTSALVASATGAACPP